MRTTPWMGLFACTAVAVGCGGRPCTRPDLGEWMFATVDREAEYRARTGFVVDGSGALHVTYPAMGLRYSKNTGTGWYRELVGGERVLDSSLALDDTGSPHVSFVDGSTSELVHARKEGDLWVRESLASGQGVGTGNSIAIDPSGTVHVTYLSGSDLVHAANEGGVWSTETIDSPVPDSASTLSIDVSGALHVAYASDARGVLYATNETGEWVVETVASLECPGSPSLTIRRVAADAEVVYVAYQDTCEGGLWIARRIAGAWEVENPGRGDGTRTAIAVDSEGFVHVAYDDYRCDDAAIGYASDATGRWRQEMIQLELAGSMGLFSTIGIDATTVHVMFQEAGDESLRHARRER